MNFAEWADINSQNIQVQIDNNEEFVDVPDGEYLVSLEVADVRFTKVGSFPMGHMRFRILNGEFAGKCIFVNRILAKRDGKDGQRIGMFLRFLSSLDLVDRQHIKFENLEQLNLLLGNILAFCTRENIEIVLQKQTVEKNGRMFENLIPQKVMRGMPPAQPERPAYQGGYQQPERPAYQGGFQQPAAPQGYAPRQQQNDEQIPF